MKKCVMVMAVLGSVISAGLVYGQGGMMGGGMMGGSGMMGSGGMMGGSALRRQFVAQNGIDPQYANKVNPLRPTAENLTAGGKLYEANCATCHGASGLGDGPAARGLNPPPANIAAMARVPMTTDGYLYWTIAEGGAPLHTAMPPFKGVLKDDQIWDVILYLRRL